jgi:hypothetical protein
MKVGADFEVGPPVDPRHAQSVERPPRVARPGWDEVAVTEIRMSIDCSAAPLTEHEVEVGSDVAADEVGKRVNDSLFTRFRIDGFEHPFGGYLTGQQGDEVAEPAGSRGVLGVWRKSKQNRAIKRNDHAPLMVIRSSTGEIRLVAPNEPSVKVVDTFQMQAQRVAPRSLHFRLTGSWH